MRRGTELGKVRQTLLASMKAPGRRNVNVQLE